ncbi:MAG: hypothetical protein HY986_13525 [Candidatus Melainabacteria bacterium]|nr:hypothetical protein [Candidatus Melainabacteria bacterium]
MYSQPSPEPRPNFQAGGKTIQQLYIQSFSTQRISSSTRVKISPCGQYTLLYGPHQPASLFLRAGNALLPLFHSYVPITEADFAYSRLHGTREVAIVQAGGAALRLIVSYLPQANGSFAMHLLPVTIPLTGIHLLAYSASSEKLFLSTRTGQITMLDCLTGTTAADGRIQHPHTASAMETDRTPKSAPVLQKLIPNSFNDNQIVALTHDGELRLEDMSRSNQPLWLGLSHETAPVSWLQYHQHLPVLAVHDRSGMLTLLKLDEPALQPLQLKAPAGELQNLDFVRDDDRINLTAVTTTSAFNLTFTTTGGEEERKLKLENSYELISIAQINQILYASGTSANSILNARNTGNELIVAVAVQ